MEVKTSTVAYSCYQALCAEGPANVGELTRRLKKWIVESGISVPFDQLDEALRELVDRGLVTETEDTFDVVDPERRFLMGRDRGGEGWDGWLVQAVRRPLLATLPIAAVTKRCETSAPELDTP